MSEVVEGPTPSSSINSKLSKGLRESRARKDVCYTYVIALYNVGVEYEFLGRLREALEYFTKAEQACKKYLP